MINWRQILSWRFPVVSPYAGEIDFGSRRLFRTRYSVTEYGDITVGARCKKEAKDKIENGYGEQTPTDSDNFYVDTDNIVEVGR